MSDGSIAVPVRRNGAAAVVASGTVGHRAAAVLLLALWVVAARFLSFDLRIADQDESYYLLQAQSWLDGALPYAAVWDVKPPLLILVFAVFRAAFFPGVLAARIASALVVFASALLLHRFARRHLEGRWVPAIAALLYPAYTADLRDITAVPELFLAPLVILAFDLVLTLVATRGPARGRALGAGLMIGLAALIKQSAVFEGAAALGLLACAAGKAPAASRLGRPAAFCMGAAAPSLAYLAFVSGAGEPWPLATTPFMAAFYRLSGDGISFGGGLLRFLPMMKPLLPLLTAALLLIPERRLHAKAPDRLAIAVVAIWLAGAAAGILAMRSMYNHYYLTLVPPLVLLTGIFLRRFMVAPGRRTIAAVTAGLAASAIFPLVWSLVVQYPDMRSADLQEAALAALRQAGMRPGDTIYVPDQDPSIYLLSGARLPTRYVFPQHMMCDFHLPDTDPMTEIRRVMENRPRFVVITHERQWMLCDLPERTALIDRYLARDDRLVTTVTAGGESIDIYRLKEPSS